MNYDGPVLCEIMCPEKSRNYSYNCFNEKEVLTMVSKPLEDMYPFLDREELKKEMINKPVKE